MLHQLVETMWEMTQNHGEVDEERYDYFAYFIENKREKQDC